MPRWIQNLRRNLTKKSKSKNEDEVFIDELKEMLDQTHKDNAWNEKFKDIVRKYEIILYNRVEYYIFYA